MPAEDLELIYNDIKELWPCNKIFFITGGTGFFGRWLVESIAFLENKLKSKNIFYILSRNNEEINFKKIPCLAEPFFKIVQGHATNFSLPAVKLDYVIHAAADVSQAKSGQESLELFRMITEGTRYLLEKIKSQSISKLIFISSGAIYGPQNQAVDESADCTIPLEKLTSGYAEAKRAGEWLTAAYSETYGFAANSVRCFAFVGPYAEPVMAVMNFLNAKSNKKNIQVMLPESVRSYMYPTDLISGLFHILFRAENKKTYNLGSDNQTTLLSLAQNIAANEVVVAVDSTVSNLAVSLGGSYYVPDIKKLRTDLNFTIKIQLDEALNKTLKWIENEKLR